MRPSIFTYTTLFRSGLSRFNPIMDDIQITLHISLVNICALQPLPGHWQKLLFDQVDCSVTFITDPTKLGIQPQLRGCDKVHFGIIKIEDVGQISVVVSHTVHESEPEC